MKKEISTNEKIAVIFERIVTYAKYDYLKAKGNSDDILDSIKDKREKDVADMFDIITAGYSKRTEAQMAQMAQRTYNKINSVTNLFQRGFFPDTNKI